MTPFEYGSSATADFDEAVAEREDLMRCPKVVGLEEEGMREESRVEPEPEEIGTSLGRGPDWGWGRGRYMGFWDLGMVRGSN